MQHITGGMVLLFLLILAGDACAFSEEDLLKVPRGQVTFDSEGNEGGRWHSRTPHVPSDNSGLTIGRGYDMKHRTRESIQADMVAAGVDAAVAEKYAGAAGLFGDKAKAYRMEQNLPEISLAAQKKLFEITYAQIETSARKICESDDVVKKYGKVDWSNMNDSIKQMVIDLRYRGEYTPKTRERVQPLVVAGDLQGLVTLMNDREFWKAVPKNRFERRAAFMNAAIKN